MGWSFRKSFKIAPGIRLNLSKGGVGVSGGVKGLRLGIGPRGTQFTAGRGGLYYRKQLSGPLGSATGPRLSKTFLVVMAFLLIVGAFAWYVWRHPPTL